jgi:hypothetical protein
MTYTATIRQSLGATEQMARMLPRLEKEFPNNKWDGDATKAIMNIARLESGAIPKNGKFKTKKEAQKLADGIWKIFVRHAGIDGSLAIDARCVCKNDLVVSKSI